MNKVISYFNQKDLWLSISVLRDLFIYLLMMDLVLCGPLGIFNYERKILFITSLILCVTHYIKFNSYSKSHLRTPITILFLVSLFWLIPIPLLNYGNLSLAWEDWDAMLFLLIPIFYVPIRNNCNQLINVVFFTTIIFTLFIFLLWVYGSSSKEALDGIETMFNSVYRKTNIFIGYADSLSQDFFPRIFFINLLWVFIGFLLLPINFRKIKYRYFMAIPFLAVIVISYTRGLWIAFLFSLFPIAFISFATFKSLFKMLIVGLFVTSVFFAEYTGFLSQRILSINSIAEKSSNQPSINTRQLQINYLLTAWSESKVLGKGFGSYVKEFPSSPDTPYSYEAVPFALMMKLGMVGFFLFLALLGMIIYRALKIRACEHLSIMIGGIFFLFVGGMTNPYIFNFIGMGIFTFFLLVLMNLEFNG